MRYLKLHEGLAIQPHILEQSGGLAGIRDFGALESALAQPKMTLSFYSPYPHPIALNFLRVDRHLGVEDRYP